MEPDPGEQILFRGHPSWMSMSRLVIRGLLWSLVLGVGAGIGSIVADRRVQALWVVAAVAAVCLLHFLRGQARRLRVTYAVTSRRLVIETGLFSRSLQQTGLGRVQNVTARQSLTDRALGVGTVHFDTAGELGYDFCFRGVDDPRRIVRTVDRALARREDAWAAGMVRG